MDQKLKAEFHSLDHPDSKKVQYVYVQQVWPELTIGSSYTHWQNFLFIDDSFCKVQVLYMGCMYTGSMLATGCYNKVIISCLHIVSLVHIQSCVLHGQCSVGFFVCFGWWWWGWGQFTIIVLSGKSLLPRRQRQHWMRSLPGTFTHDQLWETNPRPLDLESIAVYLVSQVLPNMEAP